MDPKFNTLPPLKRFRLMQQQEKKNRLDSSLLPAKKRKESREFLSPNPTEAVYVPAKKRIRAIHPDVPEEKPISQLPAKKRKETRDFVATSAVYLPAKKRIRAFHLDVLEEKPNSQLPAKKRKETRDFVPTPAVYLPAKKRIWAFHPDVLEEKPISPFDLNVEYKPPIEQNPKSPKKLDLEDENDEDGIVCAVCDSTDGDPSDPIVFCDGCDLMVHASCYGSPLVESIPEGDWFCTQCIHKGETFSCSLCPNVNGPMKRTRDGKWAHILCALLVPEVFFHDPEGREGIDCSRVPKRRYEKVCYVCDSLNGCVVDCSEMNCGLSFHVSCGFDEDLCIEYRDGGKKKGGVVAAFCKEHTELWSKQQKTGKFKIVARDEGKK